MTAAMIFQSEQPLDPACQELRSLHLALNRPVVTLERLPVGPASAAVALHANGAGSTLAVRSVRTGQLAFFTSAEDLRDAPEVALDAALSFGESMGFLFDEDEVAALGDAGPALAARRWREWIGDPVDPDVERAAPAVPATRHVPPGESAEVLLQEALPELPAPEQVLSKFRWLVFDTDAVADG